MKTLPISVCLISAAEAHRIRLALDSVAGWTSEIRVVLNEDVQDGTQELVERYGGTVYREPWRGFVAQKNSVSDKATQPWVLGLDADEAVSDALRDELQAVFDGHPQRFAAYDFPRCTEYFGRWIRHGDWYPDRCTRLWQRGQARWAGADPHARLVVEGRIGHLRGDLLHRSMETFEHQISKNIRYADDFARHCAAEGLQVHARDLLLRPLWRFVRGYLLRGGFRDGWQGCSIAWMTAFYTFLRYGKALAAQRENPK